MIAVLTGLAAGAVHAFAGVDHLAALAPIAVEDPSRAARSGGFWGLGHGVGVVIIGGLGLGLRSLFDVSAWSQWAEFAVGFLLIGVGVWALRRARRSQIHHHPHDHDDSTHAHIHAHEPTARHHAHAAIGVGLFHGMAGSGNLFSVLPALALPTFEAALYLASYLVAAMVAMSGFAGLLGVLARKGGTEWINRMMTGSGILAIAVGIVWIIISRP